MDYHALNTRAFTREKLKKMGAHEEPPGERDSGPETEDDDYGTKESHDSAQLRAAGGAIHAKGKKPHLGRMGRASGGRVFKGGKEGAVDTNLKTDPGVIRLGDQTMWADDRKPRASGGRTGKNKPVTVNVIVAGGKGQQQAAAPPPPPMPPPPMAPPPQRPPMPMPGASPGIMPVPMPSGGAPMGAAGAPPPGAPPMRARGGAVGKAPMADGHKNFGKGGTANFGKGGTRGQARIKETFGNNGKGRLEKARREA